MSTPLFNSFLQMILMRKIIDKYRIEEIIAKTLKAVTSILIVAVLNSSMTDESNNPYAKTRAKTSV